MRKTIIGIVLLFMTFTIQSQTKPNKNARYKITVNGNCEQCQKRIEQAAYSVSGVKWASWNIESHELSIILNEEKGAVIEVHKAIAQAGHDTDSIKASNTDYDKLNSCCKYKREKL